MSDINATEAALKLAGEKEINLALVAGSGAEGRITKGDVEAYLATLNPEVLPPAVEPTEAPVPAAPVEPALEADPVAAEIMALPTLGAVINWEGDRSQYAAVLQARALELLGKA